VAGPVSVIGQLGVSSTVYAGNSSVTFRIMLEETQKAPSTMALTKTNAAQIASALSFIVTSTLVPPSPLRIDKIYQKTTPLRSEWHAAVPRNWCTAPLEVTLPTL
jgi:hypothetical protein